MRKPQIRMATRIVILSVSRAMPALTARMKVTIPAAKPPLRLEKIIWMDIPSVILPEAPAAGAWPHNRPS